MRNAVIERDVGAAGAMGGDLQNALGCVVLSGRPLRQRVEDELKEGEGGGAGLGWETQKWSKKESMRAEPAAATVLIESTDRLEHALLASCQKRTQLGKQAGNEEEKKPFPQIIIIYTSFPIYWH